MAKELEGPLVVDVKNEMVAGDEHGRAAAVGAGYAVAGFQADEGVEVVVGDGVSDGAPILYNLGVLALPFAAGWRQEDDAVAVGVEYPLGAAGALFELDTTDGPGQVLGPDAVLWVGEIGPAARYGGTLLVDALDALHEGGDLEAEWASVVALECHVRTPPPSPPPNGEGGLVGGFYGW